MRKLIPILISAFALLHAATADAATCATPQPAATSANGNQIVGTTQSLSLKDGTTVHFVPTGMGTSSTYYKVIRMMPDCKQNELTVQDWDGKKIETSAPGDDEAFGCVDLDLVAQTSIIRCSINSSASVKDDMTYQVSGNTLELLRVIESEYTDATHQKRTTIYRNKTPHG